jgi:hypothetical protein
VLLEGGISFTSDGLLPLLSEQWRSSAGGPLIEGISVSSCGGRSYSGDGQLVCSSVRASVRLRWLIAAACAVGLLDVAQLDESIGSFTMVDVAAASSSAVVCSSWEASVLQAMVATAAVRAVVIVSWWAPRWEHQRVCGGGLLPLVQWWSSAGVLLGEGFDLFTMVGITAARAVVIVGWCAPRWGHQRVCDARCRECSGDHWLVCSSWEASVFASDGCYHCF